eukprot:6134139-Ditylum_brightwellii.AAC.1
MRRGYLVWDGRSSWAYMTSPHMSQHLAALDKWFDVSDQNSREDSAAYKKWEELGGNIGGF